MNEKNRASKDDINLFRELMGRVKRMETDKVSQGAPKPAPHPYQTWKDEAQVMQEILIHTHSLREMQPDAVNFSRPGVRQSVLRKLYKGHYRVSAEIDLHGMSGARAKQALAQFMQSALAANARCVRIIHGKGHRSSNQGPVLKPLVSQWLRKRDEVLAFCSARPVDGGSGALYVLLRSA